MTPRSGASEGLLSASQHADGGCEMMLIVSTHAYSCHTLRFENGTLITRRESRRGK